MAQIIRQPNETDEAWAARVKQFRETQKAFVLPPPSMPEEIKQQDRRWLPIINDGILTNIHGTEVHIPETNPFEEDEDGTEVHIPETNPFEKDEAILLPEKGGSSEKEQPKQEPVVKIESSKGGVRSAAEMDAELIRMRATLSTMQNSSQSSEQTPTGKISETVDGGGGMDWTKVSFGYELNPDGDDPLKVKIFSGRIGSLEVDEGSVVLPEDDGSYYIWLRRTRSDDTCVFQRGSAWPTDSGTYQYFVFYEFVVSAGVATLCKVRRPLDRDLLKIDGTGSPYQVFQINSAGDAVVVDWLRWS